ncbi:hypothetical protein B0I00_0001 [Novosphingobium kunmingense]|uniref:Uncharacterized protein n=2 Tax=Novosphingobium kunmingense TaxID=1211806 RepID=A0A2N0I4A9_9SPHN|nr:hypothetical protein B0I00_0001 [Novosphingobium kunmingense]
MIKRANPVDQAQPGQRLEELIGLVERALALAGDMQMHRTAAALEDALVQAERAANTSK